MQYDASSKSLSEIFPAQWVGWLGWPRDRVEVIDADVATVSGAADKIFRIGDETPWLLLVEHLTSYKDFVPERLHWHSTLIAHRHGLEVRSFVFLLRPQADGPTMTGKYEERFSDEEAYLTFRYRVIRLWQVPPEQLLAAGLGLAPLAPLGKVEPDQLLDIVHRTCERINEICPARDVPELLTSMYILMGLRYDEAAIEKIKKEIPTMEESITYQEILRKGEDKGVNKGQVAEARKLVVFVGSDRLGPPDQNTLLQIESITDLKRLRILCRGTGHVSSWEELLASK